MKYFKNIEVAKKYGINPTTVQNWINSSLEGKNNLHLIKFNKRDYIIHNSHNVFILEKLVDSSRKYKHKSQKKSVQPKPGFFKHFTNSQIVDIINNIEMNNELPHKYSYVDGGSQIWANYVKRTFEENICNTITNNKKLLELALPVILTEVNDKDFIKIIDIGCGELSPINDFLLSLERSKKLKCYIGVDISQKMIELATEAYKKIITKDIPYSFYQRDVSCSSIEDLIYPNVRDIYPSNTKNLVLFLGSTIENQSDYKKILTNIACSLESDDVFCVGITLDNEESKVFFDFSSKNKGSQIEFIDSSDQYKDWQDFIVPQLMGMEIDDFKVELFYNEEEQCRMTQLIAQKDIEVRIKNNELNTVLNIHKGQQITTWRHRHHTILQITQILDEAGFKIKHLISSPDEAHALIVCKRK